MLRSFEFLFVFECQQPNKLARWMLFVFPWGMTMRLWHEKLYFEQSYFVNTAVLAVTCNSYGCLSHSRHQIFIKDISWLCNMIKINLVLMENAHKDIFVICDTVKFRWFSKSCKSSLLTKYEFYLLVLILDGKSLSICCPTWEQQNSLFWHGYCRLNTILFSF